MSLYRKFASGLYFIAEMSANHAGSLDNAIKIVHAAKNAGADCLKIQTYTADTMTLNCDNEFFQVRDGLWDGYTLYNLYKEAGTPWEWQEQIKNECDYIGLDFLSTPFDITSVDFLEKLNVKFYKVASFELVDIPLIEYIASKGKPIIISCGMGSISEITDAIDACKNKGNDEIVLLKCCSEYPANFSNMNLATISDMKTRFGLPVGLSDHSLGSLAAVVSVSQGACIIEKHFCLSRAIKNPDCKFSMEPDEFLKMTSECKSVITTIGNSTYGLSDAEKSSVIYRRSIFVVEDIAKGDVFTKQNIRIIRPNYGLQPKYYTDVLGKKALRDLKKGMPLLLENIE